MADAQGATTTAPSAESGPRTDRLELLQQLSGGSIGTVHKARNPKFNRTVALRQLQVPEWLDDVDDLIKRILAEARAASALDHPNIARLYTGGYKGFTVFLTTEFVDGPGIREYAASRNLGVAEIIGLSRQLCAALDCAHQKDVFHNALNPANVKISADGRLKVLDLGLLRDKELYAPTPAKRLENEHYLSPEQLKSKPARHAANVFSAAIIVYELLTTRNPFAGKHLGEVDRNITEIDPPPAYQAHSRVSEAISKVLMKALAKHPLARYQSCAEFADALDEALKAVPGKAPSSFASASVAPAPATVFPSKPAGSSSTGSFKPENNGPGAPAKPALNGSNGQSFPAARPASNGSGQFPAIADKPVAPVKTANVANGNNRLPAAPPSKMPVKVLTQWKLVGGIVAALFVIFAVAISLTHRSKLPTATPETTTVETPPSTQPEPPQLVTVTPAAEATTAEAATIDVQESQPSAGKQSTRRSGPASSRVAATDGQLEIFSDPEGAAFSIEGRTIDAWKTPQVVDSLAPAVYKVTVSKPGYSTETSLLQVVSGHRTTINVRLKAVKATVNVGGTPVGARILIDGRSTGRFTPAEFTLDPAAHTITLSKEGFFDNTGRVNLTAGQTVNYSPSLTPAGRTDNIRVVGGIKKLFGGGSSDGMARMEIRTDPKGADVSLNGSILPKATPLEIQLDPGNYEMVLQKSGYKTIRKALTIRADDKVKIDEQMSQIGAQ